MDLKKELYLKFKKYIAINTQSDPNSKTYPSTKGQKILGAILVKEMKAIGLKKVQMDKFGYVTGELPTNIKEKMPVIAFMAHMDTSPDASGKNVKPKIHPKYKGGNIVINSQKGIILSPFQCPQLLSCIGEDIITASGDTLLGADNKAGIAIILTVVQWLIKNPEIKRPTIKIAFTPDEEIGKGVNFFNVKKFGADIAYTIDGDIAGAIEDETFNADGFKVKITGKSVHPGTAKDSLANAARIAADIMNSWPENILPETTSGREGFIMFASVQGAIENAEISGIAREHDIRKLNILKTHLKAIVNEKKIKYPLADIKIEFTEQYRNMKKVISMFPEIMDKLILAVKEAGIKPIIKPVRGGTDGARLSFMGLPAPNVFTGGFNFHGRYEWVSLDGMQKSAEVMLNLVKQWAKK
ncbi:MAG: peptidase T [Elusimicrobia bacterium]|nr:peptidase T [Elusimicrobiota bacterium]